MNLQLNEIMCCDCLDGIKLIPDKSVKSIICDPPYFLGMTHDGAKAQMSDLAICTPFFQTLFGEFKRVMTDNASIYFFCDWRGYTYYYAQMLQAGVAPDNCIVWDKGSGCGNFYTFEHEFIIFSTNNRKFRASGARGIIRDIPSFRNGARVSDGEKVHPTQKPVALIEKLIIDSTEVGDIVLDCFAGSGTTAIAAQRSGRHYYCFELQQKYVDIGRERVAKEKA